jgi:hypothetical protein
MPQSYHHTSTPNPFLLALVVAQWFLISFLLHRFPAELGSASKTTGSSVLESVPAKVEKAARVKSPVDSLPNSWNNNLSETSIVEGVFATVLFRAPKWFHLRYIAMIQNALSNLPQNWCLQVFINEQWVRDNLPPFHPGWKRISRDPRVSITSLPDRLIRKEPKFTYLDPWLWRSMHADRVVLFSGNGAFCGNTVYDYSWLDRFDIIGAPSRHWNGLGGRGDTHSYRNRTSILNVLDYAVKHDIDMEGSGEFGFFVSTMLKMNKEAGSSYRLATQEDTFRFGGTVNLTATGGESLSHLPLVVSGTMASLSYEERDAVLKHCPEVKMIFPSLHEPACFGAHPNPDKCRSSICALQENLSPHGC